MISILIVDDEPEARDLLAMLLEKVKDTTVVGQAENVDGAFEQVLEKEPDLILLDIQMPGKSGFDLVRRIRDLGKDTGYIFVTAYDEYAIEAIRASAFDYLLKPVDQAELSGTISRFREERKNRQMRAQIDRLLHNLGMVQRLKLNTRTGFTIIDPGQIVCCIADGNYTEIILDNDRREIISSNLGAMEREFSGNGFFRISRSSLINLGYLTHVDKKRGICMLKGWSVIELKVSRNKLSELEALFGKGPI
jgi:DNA-binding LytR/AlgR family response regulator